MKRMLILAAATALLSGCAVTDFAARQQEWNQSHGLGSMNQTPNVAGPSASEREDVETQARIKRGEDLENEEARKAGPGPSSTEGMKCTTTSSFVGSANAGTSTSHASCHN